MNMSREQRGSALLISLVVVIMAAAIGGAFLSQTLFQSNEQKWSIEADEALAMCDAGMERARQALGTYKGTTTPWPWSNIVTYCSGCATDRLSMKNQAMTYFQGAYYQNYLQTLVLASGTSSLNAGSRYGSSSTSEDNTSAGTLLPLNLIAQTASADQNKVLFGWPIAFNRGMIWIHISTPGASGVGEPSNLLVTVTAVLPSGILRQVEGLLTKPSPPPLVANGLAAVVSDDQVSTNGNITIDGRDYDYSGQNVVGPGVYGILSVKTISIGGSSSTGGYGAAPPGNGVAAGSLAQDYSFSSGYPPGPDQSLNIAPGSLKAAAQASGTYCATPAAFTALLAANGGAVPNHAIVYCDYDPGNGSLDIGSGNSQSSILVFHNDTTTSTIHNLHGSFTGLLLADAIVHVNAGTSLVGEVQMFSPTASDQGNVFGNGNSTIHFSSAVLADLPGLSTGDSAASMLAYRKLQ